jgi:hypothetical protein
MKISVNMIIGERFEPFLKYALKSAKWADEFIIVNTGSENNPNFETISEFEQYYKGRLEILDFSKLAKDFDFASARNMALEVSTGDYIFKIDADEVYYNSFGMTAKSLDGLADIYQVEFYHFMLDVFHYQYVEKKQVLFRNGKFRWIGTTHEILEPIDGEQPTIKNLQDKFCHLGYAQPQKTIFEKWQQYVEIEGRPDWYKGQDPDHILDDRKMVSQKFNYEYPEAIRDDIKDFPVVITEEQNRMPKVGLVLANPELDTIKRVKETADFSINLVIATNNPDYYAGSGHGIVVNVEPEPLMTAGIRKLMKDPDIRWVGTAQSGQVKKAVEAMIENVGMVNFSDGFLISIDAIERVGLPNGDFQEFQNRLQKNNMKVEVL